MRPKPRGKAKRPATRRAKAGSSKPKPVKLLSGGNPQIAKGEGDAPVQAYIAGMPEWKLNVGRGSGGFSEPIEYKAKPGEPPGELFNLAKDPGETRNLYFEQPEMVKSLTALLERYRAQGYSRPM